MNISNDIVSYTHFIYRFMIVEKKVGLAMINPAFPGIDAVLGFSVLKTSDLVTKFIFSFVCSG